MAGGSAMKLVALLVLPALLAACGSQAVQPDHLTQAATPTPVVILVTPTPKPTPAPTPRDIYAGKVIFGTKVTGSLEIPNPKATFDRKAPKIAWVAHFTNVAGAAKVTWQVLRVGRSEQIMWTEQVAVSPDWTITSSSSAIPKFLAYRAGKYVMRYSRGGKVLAEGTFTLK